MKKAVFLAISTFFAATTGAHAFSASFSWSGIGPCGSTSPAFRISGAPKGTAQLRFAMRDYHAPNFMHGGSTVAYSGKGAVPQGAISYVGPCPPPGEKHRYIWSIQALDASGNVVGTTSAEGMFPR